jgi:hypothetical protein
MRSGMMRALSKLQAHLSARPRDTGSTPAVRRCVAGALVPVSDLDRSITLYQDVLGLEGSPPRPDIGCGPLLGLPSICSPAPTMPGRAVTAGDLRER